mgnify:CR=1 FL=1
MKRPHRQLLILIMEQYAALTGRPYGCYRNSGYGGSNVTKLEANTPVEIDGQEFTLVTSDPKENDDMISVTAQYGSNSFELDAETLAVGDIYALKLNGTVLCAGRDRRGTYACRAG